MTPAVTNPTTSTVVTDEEFSTPVTMAPVKAPVNRFVVNLERMARNVSPATFFNPSAKNSSPNKNKASPPNRPILSCNQSMSISSEGFTEAAVAIAGSMNRNNRQTANRSPVFFIKKLYFISNTVNSKIDNWIINATTSSSSPECQ